MSTTYTNPLTLPTADAIAEGSKPILENVQKAFGFVPNLIKAFSVSPAVLEAYLTLAKLAEKTSFSPEEQQAAALIISQNRDCTYCLAAHGTLAKSTSLSDDTVIALQTQADLNDTRLEALRTLLLSIVETRGHPEATAIDAFRAAGYNDTHIVEAVLLVTWKTLSNYTNHLYNTPIDEQFAPNAAPETCSAEGTACDCA